MNHMPSAAIKLLATAIMLALTLTSAFASGYKLDRGDVLGISVFGMADFNRRTMVNVDGDISLPLIGNVPAAGITLTELQQRIQTKLSEREVGRGADVMVEIVEHRPFYVSGDVTSPGALPWRHGLNVRRAVALAGGVGTTKLKNLDTPQSAAEIMGRYNVAVAELARREARLKGLQAELSNQKKISFEGAQKLPLPETLVTQIRDLEQRNLEDRRKSLDDERRHLEAQIRIGDQQISTLEQGEKQDKITVAQQVQALQLATSLQSRGLANVARVSDEQRALSLIRSRELETIARLGRARQDRQEQARKLERTDEDRRVELTRAIQDAMVGLQQTRAEMSGLAQRLILAGSTGGQISSMAGDIEYVIYREASGTSHRVAAKPETPVEPGDVVEVTIRLDSLFGAPPETR